MYWTPKVELEIEGLNELTELLTKADEQTRALRDTVTEIDFARLKLQSKINQPTVEATTDG